MTLGFCIIWNRKCVYVCVCVCDLILTMYIEVYSEAIQLLPGEASRILRVSLEYLRYFSNIKKLLCAYLRFGSYPTYTYTHTSIQYKMQKQIKSVLYIHTSTNNDSKYKRLLSLSLYSFTILD